MDKIEYGCSMEGVSWFTTVTFRMEGKKPVTADYVHKVWARFLKMLRLRHPLVQWLKIIEATKKGQPHLHVVMNNIGSDSCKPLYTRKGLIKDCACVLHEISACWRYATYHTSWVVDVRRVTSAHGAAGYLGKYLLKQSNSWEKLADLGFSRRWSRSRNWPSETEDQLLNEDWDQVVVRHPVGGEALDQMRLQVAATEGAKLLERKDHRRYLANLKTAKNYIIKERANAIIR